jgi:hypothetical protein
MVSGHGSGGPAVAGVAILVGAALAGCAATGQAVVPAPAGQRPDFQVTWAPGYLSRTAPQHVPWDGQAGTSAESLVAGGDRDHPHSRLLLTIVTAAAYPAAYWPDLAASDAYQHVRVGEAQVALRPGTAGDSTVAICYDRGYLIQVTATGVAVADIEHLIGSLRWEG